MRILLFFILTSTIAFHCNAQHSFSGEIDSNYWKGDVYLSVIEDYRKISGVYTEQIISKTKADASGHFEFKGDQLEATHHIYRIHVDNCSEETLNKNHFDGHCKDSQEILFIANHKDTIVFPFSFDKQMFCDVKSNNAKTSAFIKIDSLKEEMRFAFSDYRSKANRKLNTKKWFKTLQNFGKTLNEPLAELYIYAFLSDRSNNLHEYYLEDLKTNTYYSNLLERLTLYYPNSAYTSQYKNELASDKYILSESAKEKSFNWNYLVYLLLALSIAANIWLWYSRKQNTANSLNNAKNQLTKQEQKILQLLLEDNSNKDIAASLYVSLSTVKTHLNNIYKKLNVQSRDDIKSMFNS